jgi:hypothetical protein
MKKSIIGTIIVLVILVVAYKFGYQPSVNVTVSETATQIIVNEDSVVVKDTLVVIDTTKVVAQ